MGYLAVLLISREESLDGSETYYSTGIIIHHALLSEGSRSTFYSHYYSLCFDVRDYFSAVLARLRLRAIARMNESRSSAVIIFNFGCVAANRHLPYDFELTISRNRRKD
eukprot:scaffold20255_cov64-Attheya_sp.AAC.4